LILTIFIIAPGGILCCSQDYRGQEEIDEEIIGGFLTGMSDFFREIKGGKIKELILGNFNYIFSYSVEYDYTFVIAIEKDDSEDEARSLVKLMKHEFIKKYKSIFPNWNNEISVFDDFRDFIEKNIYIPPKILFTGEKDVGKTTLLDLLPGEKVLELDDNMNEILEKSVELGKEFNFKECIVKEIDITTLIDNLSAFFDLLKTIDIVFFITNSAASNLGRTQDYISKIKSKISKADFYIIANFQDLTETAFEPIYIEKMLDIKTFGFTTTKEDPELLIMGILKEVLNNLGKT
jgi:signal recognition particle receptor subunit beta